MPINEQFAQTEAPEWSWGDPSQAAQPEAVQISALAPESPQDDQPVDEVIGRPWLDAMMSLVIFLVGQLVVGIIGIVVYLLVTKASLEQIQNSQSDLIPWTLIPVSIFTILAAWGWAHVGNRTPKNFLSWSFKKTDVLWALGVVLLSVGMGLVLQPALGLSQDEAIKINDSLWPKNPTPLMAMATGFTIGVLVPIAEEMIFRGMLLNALARKINKWLALVISSLLFALPHVANFIMLSSTAVWFGLIQVLLLGLVIGAIFIKTERLGPCIMAHIFNNSLVVITLLYTTFWA